MKKVLFYLSVFILIGLLISCSAEPKEATKEQSELFQSVTGFALVGWLIGGDGVDMVTTDDGFKVIYSDYPIDEDGNLISGLVSYEKVDQGDYYDVDLEAVYMGDEYSIESSFIDGDERVDFTLDGKALYVIQ